jgi:hypothetical protein
VNLSAERDLAMLAAEDGDLYDAEDSLTQLIERVEKALRADPSNADLVCELCRCLLNRASVRSWAVRPKDALADLAFVEPLLDRLKPLTCQLLRVRLLDTRARLLAAPYSPAHDPAMALKTVSELRRELPSTADSWMADVVELRIAQHDRNWPKVIELATPAFARLTELDAPRGLQALGLQLGRAWLQLGDRDKAAPYAESAEPFFAREGPPDLAAAAAIALARVKGECNGWPLAEKALALVENLTRAQRSLFDQQRYLVEKLQIYEDAFGLALEGVAGSGSSFEYERAVLRAWEVAERAKSFSLRQAMTQGGWLDAIDPESAAALAKLDSELEEVEAKADRSEVDRKRQAELAARRQNLFQSAMERNPPLARAQSGSALDVAQLLRNLPAGIGLISWFWSVTGEGGRLHIFYAGADRVPKYCNSAFDAEGVKALALARRRCVQTRQSLIGQILPAPLGDKLFPPPVLQAADGCHTLLLTPHRYLRQLPLHTTEVTRADSTGAATALIIERFAVLILQTLALPFPPQAARTRRVLLLGCRQDGFRSPPLDDVPSEVENLHKLWRTAGRAVEPYLMESTQRLADHAPLERWRDFDLIHLACHGRFIPDSPLDASLYLGREAVRASEFFRVKLNCDVVCLSACDVGQHTETLDGLTVASDEWLGLSLPLFQAGARTLLFSLWQANSGVAREFMEDFHSGLTRGLDPARAHQGACLAQIAKRSPFGLWTNWQLVGFPTLAAAAIGRGRQ